ncbi:MAG: hypothetical protein HKO81_09645 [Flavobacteriaceae bacterium]|nr:hypothetical protein [Eudoraea sp.]NNL16887.1 hypothetical protein [Flavobacteriaceae bacterium]
MKAIIRYLYTIALLMLLFLISTPSLGQVIYEAPEDKAVVYFVRTVKGGSGILHGHEVFCENGPIGILTWKNFIRYECDPGSQLFGIARRKPTYQQFVDAELSAGKIYLIEVRHQFQGIRMEPVNPNSDLDRLDRIRSIVNSKGSIKAHKMGVKKDYYKKRIPESTIKNGLKWYPAYVEKGDVKQLQPDWFIEPEDLVVERSN